MKKLKGILYTNRYYLLIVGIAAAIIILFNIFVGRPFIYGDLYSIGEIFMWVAINIVVVFVFFGIISGITRLLPKKLFNPYNRNYKVTPKEMKFYDNIKIKKWKDKVPEMGQYLTSFGKTKIDNPNDPKYMYTFIEETCYAEVMHSIAAVLGYLIILMMWPIEYCWCFGIPVAFVAMFLHLFPVMIQRYNRSKLIKIYEHQLKNNEKKNG